MVIQIVCGVAWLIIGLAGIRDVENWSFFWDGTMTHWWVRVNIPIYISSLLFRIAYLKNKAKKGNSIESEP